MIKNSTESINVLLVGNNPIDLSTVYEKIQQIKKYTVSAEVNFDIKGLFKSVGKLHPNCILIDDNIDRSLFRGLLTKLSRNPRTKDIPVAILKNNNREIYAMEAEEFILKAHVTSDELLHAILNTIRMKKTRQKLAIMYKQKKKGLARWIA